MNFSSIPGPSSLLDDTKPSFVVGKNEARHPFQDDRKQLQFAYEIEGVHTDFIITSFDSMVFIIVTQLEKIGSLVKAFKDSELAASGEHSYSMHTLLGSRNDKYVELLARQLIESISKSGERQLILATGFKPKSVSMAFLKAVLDLIVKQKIW